MTPTLSPALEKALAMENLPIWQTPFLISFSIHNCSVPLQYCRPDSLLFIQTCQTYHIYHT